MPADCRTSSCNRHRTTAHQRHMTALPTLMQSLHTPSASLHHACTKHTHRGSTYRSPQTFRSPKLSGRVASFFLDKSLQPSPHHRPSASHASPPHLDAILAHPFSITAPSMHKAHTEGQHLQVAPNLQVAKALRQYCQLIPGQDPADSITPLPISVTLQHSPS